MELGKTPMEAKRRSSSLQVRPASTRTFSVPSETKVTLPLLPLPSTEIRRPMTNLPPA